jgi:hypothetical protein
LKAEIDEKDENVLFLKNEILYFIECLSFGNYTIISNNSATKPRKNTNFSLERGPLPAIKEHYDDKNSSRSPRRKLEQPS